jgi:hypothetical protein
MQEKSFAAEGWPELCSVRFFIPDGFLVVMPRARPLTDAQWQQLDYRACVTRGEWWVAENFDARVGDWRQGEIGRPLCASSLAMRKQMPALRRQSTSGTVLVC